MSDDSSAINSPIVTRLKTKAKTQSVSEPGRPPIIPQGRGKKKENKHGKRHQAKGDTIVNPCPNTDPASVTLQQNETTILEHIDMEDLKKHMELLQKKSEKNIADALKATLEKNKKEMEDKLDTMVTTLKNSIGDVKTDLSNLDKLQT